MTTTLPLDAAKSALSNTATTLTAALNAALQHIPHSWAPTSRNSDLDPYPTRRISQGQTPYPGEVPARSVLLLAVRTGLGLSDPYGGISHMRWPRAAGWRP